MKLYIPLRQWIISQPFAKNYNTYYAEDKLAGHTGIDLCAIGEDKTIYASTDSYVFSIVNKDNKDLMRYRCVYTLIEDSGIFYELSYGHFFDIYVNEGQNLKRGDKLGIEGNTGDVASGGMKVTALEKKQGSTKGRHLHFQLRLVKPVEKVEKGKRYLRDSKGKFFLNGMYYERVPNLGFADCIDPKPFLIEKSAAPSTIVSDIVNSLKPSIKRVLKYGSRGNDVKVLQNLLQVKSDGIFGKRTEQAVRAFQASRGLVQDGIVGPLTLTALFSMR